MRFEIESTSQLTKGHQMEKFNFSLDRKVVALFVLVVGTYFAFTHDVKTAQATTNVSGLTGQYGCMLNRNGSGYGVLWQNDGVWTNMISYMDYSNNTTKNLATETDHYNTTNVSSSTQKFTTTFTETAVSEVTSTYKTVHSITNGDGSNGGTATFIGIVVNSGNTILMTQTEDGQAKATWSGVCQKI
jgi:hypothetical protein